MSSNLFDSMTPETKQIIGDFNNWFKDFMPETCALCKKAFKEHEVPLILWANEGKWAIEFHMKCAFGKNVSEDSFEDEDEEEIYIYQGGDG
jgi:aspartate aminotransferase-like enzyme